MILVFFIICILVVMLIIMSTISIRVDKLQISNYNTFNKLEYDYIVYWELLFFNRLKILSIRIDKNKIEELKLNQKVQKIKLKNMRKELTSKDMIKDIIKELKIELAKLNLDLKIGTEDVIITSGIIVLLSSLIGIIIAKFIRKYDKEKYKYQICPVYQNKNLINLNLNCIIKVKMVHIIYIIYVFVKKGRVNKYERTSNRRSYDYSYE